MKNNSCAYAFALGIISVFMQAPFFFWPLIFVVFPVLYFLADQINNKTFKKHHNNPNFEIGKLGLCFGLGYYISGLHWICLALLIDFKTFFWLIPIAIFAIGLIMAIFIAIKMYIYSFFINNSVLVKIIIFSIIWIIVDIISSYIPFGGFPWLLAGYSLTNIFEISFMASIFGIHGVSLIAVYFGLQVVSLYYRSYFSIFISLSILIICIIYSNFTKSYQKLEDSNIVIKIIQGNVRQELKWNPELRYNNFLKYLTISKSTDNINVKYIIWPESAVEYPMDRKLASLVSDIIPDKGALITGALRQEKRYSTKNIYNSMFIIGKNSNIIDHYDKMHLVPFGEYVPLRMILPINKITPGMVDLSPGKNMHSISIDKSYKFLPQICFETIFPYHYQNIAKDDARWILNITNDGWYGNSIGPYQHFHMLRFRAIEQGMPAIRAANTGISGIIDLYGKILDTINYGTEGVIKANIPLVSAHKTIYARYGDIIIIGIIVVTVIILITGTIIKKKEK